MVVDSLHHMRKLAVLGLAILVIGAVLVFGVYPYIVNQATEEILTGLKANMTSASLMPGENISFHYVSLGKNVYIFYYNSSQFPLLVEGVPVNASTQGHSAYYVISSGQGTFQVVNNYSQPVTVYYSQYSYYPGDGTLIGALIIAGIPMMVVGVVLAVLGFLNKRGS
ncbi:hypothetical protein MetMK1DRAFT_00016530 [Metallosphaera yellowstonensis MK1]|jgi:hypothetical protein|uniref:Uncharacterized protein n=2 Tax=Metallosphaera TaxID=41980 RepID=H2C153_9CREN|nr:hypothetical protein MetMK1DRAFT_00016530 [Metallosphaera yellowstonensis MK1]